MKLGQLAAELLRRFVQLCEVFPRLVVEAAFGGGLEQRLRVVARNADKGRGLLKLLRGKRQRGHGHFRREAVAVDIRADGSRHLRPRGVGPAAQRLAQLRRGVYDLVKGVGVAVLGGAAIAELAAAVHRGVCAKRDHRRREIGYYKHESFFTNKHRNTSAIVFPKNFFLFCIAIRTIRIRTERIVIASARLYPAQE